MKERMEEQKNEKDLFNLGVQFTKVSAKKGYVCHGNQRITEPQGLFIHKFLAHPYKMLSCYQSLDKKEKKGKEKKETVERKEGIKRKKNSNTFHSSILEYIYPDNFI